MTDLAALNAAVQADKGAAKSVKAWIAAATPLIQPPAPPPPSGALDDMRAIHMQAISSTGAVVNPDGTPIVPTPPDPVRSQTPANFWSMLTNDSSLIYTNNDVGLIPDPRFGQVYRFRTNGNSRNPYWSSPTTVATELTQGRTMTEGQEDWYGFSVMWEPGWDWTKINWASVFQFGYPTLTSPPFMIGAGYGDQFYAQRDAGAVTQNAAGSWVAAEYQLEHLGKQSAYAGHWLDFLIGITWGSHHNGAVEVSTRCIDLSQPWEVQWSETALNTWQWGGALNVPQDPIGFKAVCDKLDSYWGFLPPITHATAPEVYLRHTGHVRCADKATALAYMG